MSEPAASAEPQRYDWDYFVTRSGDEGRAWMLEYARPEHAAIVRGAEQALKLCFQRRFEPARALLENRAPLCVLGDGAEVDYALLARHCAALPDLAAEAQTSVRFFSDQAFRSKHHDRFVLALYLLPGIVIPSAG